MGSLSSSPHSWDGGNANMAKDPTSPEARCVALRSGDSFFVGRKWWENVEKMLGLWVYQWKMLRKCWEHVENMLRKWFYPWAYHQYNGIIVINRWETGWWWLEHESNFMTFHIVGKIIPTDELLFFRGVGIPPTRKMLRTCWVYRFINGFIKMMKWWG